MSDPAAAFVDRFSQAMADAGMPRMPARIFAAVLASEAGALTAAELAAQLAVSPAAISGAVRYLVQVGMLGRERPRGARVDRYVIGDDMWYVVATRRDAVLHRWEQDLAAGVAALGPETAAGRRLDESRRFFAFLGRELPRLMDRWRAERDQ